jgi:hypothetical protein
MLTVRVLYSLSMRNLIRICDVIITVVILQEYAGCTGPLQPFASEVSLTLSLNFLLLIVYYANCKCSLTLFTRLLLLGKIQSSSQFSRVVLKTKSMIEGLMNLLMQFMTSLEGVEYSTVTVIQDFHMSAAEG